MASEETSQMQINLGTLLPLEEMNLEEIMFRKLSQVLQGKN